MRSKLALAALVAVSFVGVTTMASAQTQTPAPGASSEGNVGNRRHRHQDEIQESVVQQEVRRHDRHEQKQPKPAGGFRRRWQRRHKQVTRRAMRQETKGAPVRSGALFLEFDRSFLRCGRGLVSD